MDGEAGPLCECDAGFVHRDALGHPSCVPRAVLVAGYSVLAGVGVLASLFLLLHAARLRRQSLSLRVKTSRRTGVRQRLVLSAGWYTVGCAAVFAAAACFRGSRTLWGDGVCEVFYTLFLPSRMVAIAMVAALWVNSIPVRSLPASSKASRHRKFSEDKRLYEKLGLCGFAATLAAGLLSWSRPSVSMVVANAVSSVGEVLVGVCIVSVARQTTRVIDGRLARSKSSTTTAFYAGAKRGIMVQARALLVAALVHLVATFMLHFTEFGRQTPILFLSLQFSDGMLWLCFVVHFAAGRDASAASVGRRTRGSVSLPETFEKFLSPTSGGTSPTGTGARSRPISFFKRLPPGRFILVRAYVPVSAVVPE